MKKEHLFCPLCEHVEPVRAISPYSGHHELFQGAGLFQCNRCGLIFINPMPSNDDLEAYYKTVWSTSDEVGLVYQIQAEERVKYLMRHMVIPADAKILDVGSGHGLLFEALKHQGFSRISFTATDPSPENLDRLKKRGILTFDDIKRLDEQKFDLITICFVLEHIPAPVPFLCEITKKMNPGGFLFIDVPERDDTFKDNLEPHVMVYTSKSLNELARKMGLTVVHSTGYGQRRDVIIRDNKQSVLIKKIRAVRDRIFNLSLALLPRQSAEHIKRKHLYDCYKFDEEGTNRWWTRILLKKK